MTDSPVDAKASQPAPARLPRPARLAVVAGFLGAGKTTALASLAEHCRKSGIQPALITNDPGRELADTAALRGLGWRVAEVEGGCFGARFDALAGAAAGLAEEGAELLIAEPAGTCASLGTDLLRPWRKRHGEAFRAGPISVLIDPRIAEIYLGLAGRGSRPAGDLAYIYGQQLEEADILVINKADRHSSDRLRRVNGTLKEKFPGRPLFEVSARTTASCRAWFDAVLRWNEAPRAFAEMDRARWAAAASKLSWLNSTVELSSRRYFDGTKVVLQLVSAIQGLLREEAAEVMHCKMVLVPAEDVEGIGIVSLAGNDEVPEVWREPSEPVSTARLTVNLRAQASPELLNRAVNQALLGLVEGTPHLFARMQHSEHFRLG